MNYLLITPNLFGYYKDMITYLNNKGHYVKWYYDSITLSLKDKVLNKVNKRLTTKLFDKYWNQIISETREVKFDKVVVIFGDRYLKGYHVSKLKQAHLEAKFIYYAWDSVCKYPNILDYYKMFDRYFSFDPDDCKLYGFEFRSLYYSNDYIDIEPQFDYCSIMTFGKDKANDYKMIKALLPNSLKGKEYLYLQSKSSYVFNKIRYPKLFKGFSLSAFNYKSLQRKETNELMASSKVIIDCPRKNQIGLTIRTFEALHLNRKLITTNKSITDYEFYCPDNIFIVDEKTESIPAKFFDSDFNENYKLSDAYTFENFMNNIFELD